ncbi:MAG TPA: DUF3592 domain-containing protein [Planctomycetota bacterium]|nr:DUF3592 domain-containing protein [Planctomycetota bacterium]
MAITQTSKDQAKSRRFLGCFFGFFLLFGLAMSFFFLWPLVEIAQARSWRQVPCTILTSRVESHSSGKGGPTYSVEVTYEYLIDDEPHVGKRYQFMAGSSSGFAAKQEIVDLLPPGTKTVCYVNRRDPQDSVIDRGFTVDILFGFIPLLFALIGAAGLFGMFVYKRTPALPGAVPGLPSGTAAGTAARGPVRLKTSSSPAVRFGCLFIFAFFWNAIVSVFVVQCYSGWKSGHSDGCLTVFLIPFVLLGLGVIGLAIHGFLAIFNARPSLQLGSATVALGDTVEVLWETTGNVDRVRSFSITLEGREEATYKRGTSSSTDKSTFAVIPVVQSNRGKEMRRGKATLTVPADSMHSFKSPHSKFVWAMHVKGDIPWWPDIKEEYPIDVLPQRNPPGGPV